jgi:multimeric flavodoxin WrbA
MKVIAFNGSPHENGTARNGITALVSELEKAGVQSEVLHVGGLHSPGCSACGSCRKTGRCKTDDIVNESRAKLDTADGIILASPVYYGGIAGSFKCFLDRLFYTGPKLRRKVGAVICSVRRTGGIGVFQQLCNYLNLAGVIIAPGVYWSVLHGNSAAESEGDLEGLYTLRYVGRNMAWLLKTLEAGGKSVPPPEDEERVWTNFIR